MCHVIWFFKTLYSSGPTFLVIALVKLIWIKSLNAPIAAFTMAVLLCSYCFSSIRTARRDAQTKALTEDNASQRHLPPERKDTSWIQQALEESRSQNGGNGRGRWSPVSHEGPLHVDRLWHVLMILMGVDEVFIVKLWLWGSMKAGKQMGIICISSYSIRIFSVWMIMHRVSKCVDNPVQSWSVHHVNSEECAIERNRKKLRG